jgi:hypothetical protein
MNANETIDEIFEKTKTPLRMLKIYNASQDVLKSTDIKFVKSKLHEIKPELDLAVKNDLTKLEALYRAAFMDNHLKFLIIKKLKDFYLSSLKTIRLEIDDKILEIESLTKGVMP